jgi:glycerol-3-phosphate acyltransferase PlsX
MTAGNTIAVDGMGGDDAPAIVVDGLDRFAAERRDFRFLLAGDEAQLRPLLAAARHAAPLTELMHAEAVIAMDAKPSLALRQGRRTSMWAAIQAVKDGGAAAAVSAGNTGALMAIAKLVLRTAEGLRRPALVGSWPTLKGVSAVLDLGADIAADAEQLIEFAIMGEAFARAVHHKPRPTIGLLNIGSEEMKGHDSIREAARLMRELNLPIEFLGFVEGDDISMGAADVVVADGFSGNIALKSAEGVARMFTIALRESLTSSLRAKLGAAIALPALAALKARFDPRSVNGGVFVGLNGIVVKSHGGADAVGFARALAVAADLSASDFQSSISANLKRLGEALTMRTAVGASEEPAK